MTRLTRKESQESTRKRLRDAAEAAIARNGLGGVGIADITESAGFSRGAFYANYRSKPELLIDMLADRQVREIRHWNEMFCDTNDLEQCLADVVEQTEDMVRILERSMTSIELQLEAERNADFRPHFLDHLDIIYAEMRVLFTTILARHGKAAPHDLDAFVIIAYQFGLNLASSCVLGAQRGQLTTPGALMVQFLNRMIEAAPPLESHKS